MTKSERDAYQQVLRRAAKRLDLPLTGNTERTLVEYVIEKVRRLMQLAGRPKNLSDLLERVTQALKVEIVEINSDADLRKLFERIRPEDEPAVALLPHELDDKTDAVILQRQKRRFDWEMPFLAVINCRSWHQHRKYFSKWHELVHLILDGEQLKLEFRKTSSGRKHAEEILVDKIAGAIAFHPDLFDPVLTRELAEAGKLTFEVVDNVRMAVAPDASRHAAAIACVRASREPICLVRAQMGLKRAEERQLNDLLAQVTRPESLPSAKLRVKEASSNGAFDATGIRLHKNMEVPAAGVAARAFEISPQSGFEKLELWRTSDGPIGHGMAHIEAVKFGDEVWCFVRLIGEAARTLRQAS